MPLNTEHNFLWRKSSSRLLQSPASSNDPESGLFNSMMQIHFLYHVTTQPKIKLGSMIESKQCILVNYLKTVCEEPIFKPLKPSMN